jgi:hypothetical protein
MWQESLDERTDARREGKGGVKEGRETEADLSFQFPLVGSPSTEAVSSLALWQSKNCLNYHERRRGSHRKATRCPYICVSILACKQLALKHLSP